MTESEFQNLIIRIDERTGSIVNQLSTFETRLLAHEAHDEKNFVTKGEFATTRAIAYGIVSVALFAIIGALVNTIIVH